MDEMVKFVKTEIEDRKVYFKEGDDEISNANLKILMTVNIAMLLLLVAFILITPFIIHEWRPSIYHIGFLPGSFLCCIITFGYIMFGNKKAGASVRILCVMFELVLFFFCILIDTAGTPSGPSTFTPLMFIVIPSLFILPEYLSYILVVAVETMYIFSIITFKDMIIGQYDIFSSIVALACSVVVENMILFLRVRDYKMQMKYKQLSMKDSLSDLLNKSATMIALRQYFQAHNPDVTCTFLIMDLDDFKKINDTKGHAAGDTILRMAGLILQDTFQPTDVIGRFGGDEFIVLLKGVASRSLIQKKCGTVQMKLRQTSKEMTGIEITSSFGVVSAFGQDVDSSAIFYQADSVLYEAKRRGKGICVIKDYMPIRSNGEKSQKVHE